MFFLILTAFKRRCEADLSPAVMICEDLHALSPGSKEILARVFQEMTPKWALFPICTSIKGQLGEEFRDIPFEKFRIPSLGTEEFKKRLNLLPEDVRTPEFGVSIRRHSRGKIVPLYHEILAKTGPEDEKDGSYYDIIVGEGTLREDLGPSVRLLLKQDPVFREVLFVSYLAGDVLSLNLVENFFVLIDMTRARLQTILGELKSFGFLRRGNCIHPVFPEIFPCLIRDPSLRIGLIEEKFADFLFHHWQTGEIRQDDLILRVIGKTSRYDKSLEIYRSMVEIRLDSGDWEGAKDLLFGEVLSFEPAKSEIRDAAETVILTGRLRLAMGTEDSEGTEELFSQIDSLPLTGKINPYFGDSVLVKAWYHVKHRDIRGSLALSKGAVVFFQERGDFQGIARANTALGVILMSQESITEGIEYFRIARSAVDGKANVSERLRCLFFEAAAYFIRGNFSRVLEICSAAAAEADSLFMRRWAILSRFFIGRALFELGEYEEARGIFEHILSECGSAGHKEPLPVLFGWIGRCLVFHGKPEDGLDVIRSLPAGPETLFFRAEAEYFMGDIEKARESIDRALRHPLEPQCFLGDSFSWPDGFYFAENIALGRTKDVPVLRQLSRAFRAFLLALGGESLSGLEEMSRLTREEKNSENDPYNRLYYYWYSRILPEKRDQVFEDRLTILGKAVNHLQTRISRIDEPKHKAAYAGKNLWNRMLFEDARSHNLV